MRYCRKYKSAAGGYGAASLTFEEEASLCGNIAVINETDGNIIVCSALDNKQIKYTGNTSASLTLNNIASFGDTSEFHNDSNGTVSFSGNIDDGVVVSLEGTKGGSFSFLNGVNFYGNCKLVNDSSGYFYMKNVNVPEGVVLRNLGTKGIFRLTTDGSGVVDIDPGTDFTVVNTNTNTYGSGLYNWDSLRLKSGTLNIEGSGSGYVILNGGYGGTMTFDVESNVHPYYNATRYDWDGEKVRCKFYTPKPVPPERHLWISTPNLGKYTDVESTVSVYLRGSFADDTTIRVTGDSNNGNVYFYGKNSGLIQLEYTGGVGSYVTFENDLDGLEGFVYNSVGSGKLYVRKGVSLGKNIKINNNALVNVYFNSSSVAIGDNVTINVSKDRKEHVYITESVPVGTVLNY